MKNDTKALTYDLFALIDAMQSGKKSWSEFDKIVTSGFKAFVPGQTQDINSFKTTMQSFANGFSNASHTLTNVVAEDEKVMVREVWQGTHTGEFLGASPSNKKIEIVVFALVVFDGDKIREFHEVFDTLTLMRQTGVIEN
ncbi:protein of unknown function DUF1486 [candidate division TM7 genomosp. GTL1]|nr:protein of unknown function DUF1486 [candidate division TM7 genomosp. GTL1]